MYLTKAHYRDLIILFTLGLLAGSPVAAFAQNGGVQGEVNTILSLAEQKFNGLAETLTEEQYAWRPGEGVRSVSEALLHIAGNNYRLPILLGCEVPKDIPITLALSSVEALEKTTDRDEIVATVATSFTHLKACIAGVSEADVDQMIDVFGTPRSRRIFMIFIATHMHEHLGQLIAYARMNGTTPPWSQ